MTKQEVYTIVSTLFNTITGYEGVKTLFLYSLNATKPVNILLVGPPASAKSMFLLELERLPKAYFALGSLTSKAGLANVLIEQEPRYLLMDEFERLSAEDFSVFLALCETGHIVETKFNKTRSVDLTTWVFACANDTSRIPGEVLSRFEVLEFKPYSREEFIQIVANVLERREEVETDLAWYIAKTVWDVLDAKDVREAIRIGRLARTKAEVDSIVKILRKYRTLRRKKALK